jgi:hypothetical protein
MALNISGITASRDGFAFLDSPSLFFGDSRQHCAILIDDVGIQYSNQEGLVTTEASSGRFVADVVHRS